MVGALAGGGLALWSPWQVAALGGWDVGGLILLVWVWAVVGRLSSDEARRQARHEDVDQGVADILLVVASIGCLVGVGFTLQKATGIDGAAKGALVALALASVAVSWSVVHTVFALRYARTYYGDPEGGIDFNDDDDPDYHDFAYLALTIGMTYQVSDTGLTSKAMRRVALRHALLSFLFGTFILATTINVVAGLIK